MRKDLLAMWMLSKDEKDMFAFPAEALVETILERYADDFAIDGQSSLTHSAEYNVYLSKILFASMTSVSVLFLYCATTIFLGPRHQRANRFALCSRAKLWSSCATPSKIMTMIKSA